MVHGPWSMVRRPSSVGSLDAEPAHARFGDRAGCRPHTSLCRLDTSRFRFDIQSVRIDHPSARIDHPSAWSDGFTTRIGYRAAWSDRFNVRNADPSARFGFVAHPCRSPHPRGQTTTSIVSVTDPRGQATPTAVTLTAPLVPLTAVPVSIADPRGEMTAMPVSVTHRRGQITTTPVTLTTPGQPSAPIGATDRPTRQVATRTVRIVYTGVRIDNLGARIGHHSARIAHNSARQPATRPRPAPRAHGRDSADDGPRTNYGCTGPARRLTSWSRNAKPS
jgi:hypothetical protein